jgi:RimJ/RimL family protein N-acetyltransferase
MPYVLTHRPRLMRGPPLESAVSAPSLRTERLLLRPHRLSDAEDWFELQSNPDVVRYLSWPLRDRRASRIHLRHRTHHVVLSQIDDFLALAIELDGRLIGDVSLNLRTVAPGARSLEIGWVLNPRFGGNGYATEATHRLLRFAFDDLAADWVYAHIERDNLRSIALADRVGFERMSARGRTVAMILGHETFRQLDADRASRERGIERRRS